MTDLAPASLPTRPVDLRLGRWNAAVICGLAAGLAWMAALMGLKASVALMAVVAFAGLLTITTRSADVLLVTAVLSLGLMVRKSLGPLSFVPSGAAGLYVSSVDVIVVLLYADWLFSGSLADDLHRLIRCPAVRLPFFGALLLLPSLVTAGDRGLAAAELMRMVSLFALFLVVAARVRSRRDVHLVLLSLAAIAVIELVIVAGQKVTGGPLGLSFLGTPTTMVAGRVTTEGVLNRPFGTINHPVFMAAFLSQIGLVACALACGLRRRSHRLLALGIGAVSFGPLVISQTRAAVLGVAVAAPVLVLWALATRRLSGRGLAVWCAVGLGLVTLASPQLLRLYNDNFHTPHFDVEVESRSQLNDVAFRMFADAPLVGWGLNNFQAAAARYEDSSVIFAGNPVHNVYLLQLSETGVIGFAGLLVTMGALAHAALRLARSRDRLYSAIGAGVAATYLFFAVEEVLLFALRQEAPRTLLWVLAGVVLACTELSERDGTLARPVTALRARPEAIAPHRAAHLALAVLVVGGGGMVAGGVRAPAATAQAAPQGAAAAAAPEEGAFDLLVAGADRRTGRHGIYRFFGGVLTKISADDGMDYFWPVWAYGGKKVVFTARTGPEGSPEQIYMMNPDGSGRIQLTDNPWRNQQPKVSPDGRSIVFTSSWPQFEHIALFRLDLTTLRVSNISAALERGGSFDADPRWHANGARVVFANTVDDALTATVPTQIDSMAADGTDRRHLVSDTAYNVDPAVSPDERLLTYSSYRGGGNPRRPGSESIQVKLGGWFLPVVDLATGKERVLNRGLACAERAPDAPCRPEEPSAFNPVWTHDSKTVGYLGALSSRTMCVCAMEADGSDPRVVLATDDIALTWVDWTNHVAGAPVPAIPPPPPPNRMLIAGTTATGATGLWTSRADRWGEQPLPLPAGFQVLTARWSPDRRQVVFAARAPEGAVPLALRQPRARKRIRHYTLDVVDAAITSATGGSPAADKSAQVYVMNANGSGLRRLTSPTIEDWRDAVPDGEERANVDPDMSPDGRFVVFTNISPTGESFVLRLDLRTGEVLNLTNATAGAQAVSDATPRFSPDGRRVALSSSVGATRQIFVMDADGRNAVNITRDTHINDNPVWSPDGQSVAFSSYRKTTSLPAQADASGEKIDRSGWVLVNANVRTRRQDVFANPRDQGAFAPAWSPDGKQLLYIAFSPPGQGDLRTIDLASKTDRVLQVTQLIQERSVDWR